MISTNNFTKIHLKMRDAVFIELQNETSKAVPRKTPKYLRKSNT